jgi:MoaA/NifB/PqqE/SkfB family radical SAM enzyme
MAIKPVRAYTQHPPYAVQIELVEGCNLRCPFCGIRGIRGKENNLKFMSMELAERITNLLLESEWNPRIEFAMHGEPSLHPDMLEILRMFRRSLPENTHLMMSSNGAGFKTGKRIEASLKLLNVLVLESYEHSNLCQEALEHCGHTLLWYPKNTKANPHRRRTSKDHDLVIVQDIRKASSGTHSTLNNHCGCGAPLDYSMNGKRCAKPFRELSIRWDGKVSLCCNDWRGLYHCGDVLCSTLDEIWQDNPFSSARRFLYYGQRDFVPCKGCNASSYRPGLLPDPKGVQTLPKPTEKDQRAVLQATSCTPYSSIVLRSWESDNKKPPT